MPRFALPLLLSSMLLTACGQSGDLYLPDEAGRRGEPGVQPAAPDAAPAPSEVPPETTPPAQTPPAGEAPAETPPPASDAAASTDPEARQDP